MRRTVLYCTVVMLLACLDAGAQGNFTDRAKKYIDEYSTLAILEQQKNGIPASVTLAQGILETEAGNSELMVEANNHFGIKCKNGWTGETFTHTDDLPDECFKKYKCAQESYRDHSEHLKRNPRYAPLFQISKTDYAGWAKCLKRCGYATSPTYAQKLIQIIEDFNLQQYTFTALDSSLLNNYSNNPVANAQNVIELPKKPVAVTEPKEPVKASDMRIAKSRGGDTVVRRIIVTHDRHIVAEGETLAGIAQSEGVDIKKIMELNMLYPNEEPVTGSTLELQKPNRQKPMVTMHAMTAHKENAIVQQDDKPAAANSDYVVIDKNKPKATNVPTQTVNAAPPSNAASTMVKPNAAEGGNKVAETVTPPVTQVPQPPVKTNVVVKKTAVKPIAAAEVSTPEKDQELASLKAELDKVVYADDSKLIAENTPPPPMPTLVKKAEPEPVAAKPSRIYTVKKGDTAFGIAKKNNITLDQLNNWNRLEAGGIKIGQNLRVKE